jgi:hypothetical protein
VVTQGSTATPETAESGAGNEAQRRGCTLRDTHAREPLLALKERRRGGALSSEVSGEFAISTRRRDAIDRQKEREVVATVVVVLIVLVVQGALGATGGWISAQRGRGALPGFLLGFFLSGVGVLITALLPRPVEHQVREALAVEQAVDYYKRTGQLPPATSRTSISAAKAGRPRGPGPVPRQIDAEGRPIRTPRPVAPQLPPVVSVENPRDCAKCGRLLPEGWRFLTCSDCLFEKKG